jgi:hypothetical protein
LIIGDNEGSNEKTRKGLKIQEEGILEEDYNFGVLCQGRRYKRQKTRDEKGDSCNELEGREPCTIV